MISSKHTLRHCILPSIFCAVLLPEGLPAQKAPNPNGANATQSGSGLVAAVIADKQLDEQIKRVLRLFKRSEFDELQNMLSIHQATNQQSKQLLQQRWQEFISKKQNQPSAGALSFSVLECQQKQQLAYAIVRLNYDKFALNGCCFAVCLLKENDNWKIAPLPDSFANINLPINLQNRQLLEQLNNQLQSKLEHWNEVVLADDDIQLFKYKQRRLKELLQNIDSARSALQLLHRSIYEKNVDDIFVLTCPEQTLLEPKSAEDYRKLRQYHSNLKYLFNQNSYKDEIKEWEPGGRHNLVSILQDSVVNLLKIEGGKASIYSIKSDRYSDRKELFYRTDLQLLQSAASYQFKFLDSRLCMTGHLMDFNDERERIAPVYSITKNLPECPRSELVALLTPNNPEGNSDIKQFCQQLDAALQSQDLLEILKLHKAADLKDNELTQLRRMTTLFGNLPHCKPNRLSYFDHLLDPSGKQAVIFLKGITQPHRIFYETSYLYALLDEKSGKWHLYHRYGNDGDIKLAAIEKVKNTALESVKKRLSELNNAVLPEYLAQAALPAAPQARQVEQLLKRFTNQHADVLVTLQTTLEGKKQIESGLRYLRAEFNKQDALITAKNIYSGKHICAASIEIKTPELPLANVLVILLPHQNQWRLLGDHVLYASSNKGRAALNTRSLKALKDSLPPEAYSEIEQFYQQHNKYYTERNNHPPEDKP